jgi:prolipoprotein diacylglyceryltransferase
MVYGVFYYDDMIYLFLVGKHRDIGGVWDGSGLAYHGAFL